MIPNNHLLVPAAAFEPVPEWLPECWRVPFTPRAERLMACHFAKRALPVWLAHYPDDLRPAQAIRDGMLYADGVGSIDGTSANYAPAGAPLVAYWAFLAAHSVVFRFAEESATNAAACGVMASRRSVSVASGDEAAERETYAQQRIKSLYVRRRWPDSWRTDAVRGVAEAIYAGQDWDSVPILADALADAGCTDTNWLSWLRSEELLPHWHRGQWPFDFGGGVA